jgi:nucleoside-diphosphate-sugar epimerase
MISKKKILLVGGCGFIGHNLALYLLKLGHEPVIVDSLSINNIYSQDNTEVLNQKLYTSILKNRVELLKKNNIDLIIQDARNYHSISALYTQINPDIIIHLAAVSHANRSNKDPHTTFDHSLRTLENTLDFAKNKKTHTIYISSSMVYGNFVTNEVDEDTTCKPIGIYGTLKYAGELIVKSYNQVFDLPYTIIRPSALYGERCVSRRVGQIFIENAIQNFEININGDGNDKLDFTYIEDLVRGISYCCDNEKSKNETFNITAGNARKINDLIDILKNEFKDIKINYKEREKFMPERGTLRTDKAKKLLNFKANHSIESGYQKYINWYKNFWDGVSK